MSIDFIARSLARQASTSATTAQNQVAALPPLDTDATLSANSDTRIASQKAMKAYADGISSSLTTVVGTKLAASAVDTDTGLTASSDTRVASQKAAKAYTDAASASLTTALANKLASADLASSVAGKGASLVALSSALATGLVAQDMFNLVGPRNAANAAKAAALASGSIARIGGLFYQVDSTKTGAASCTNDLAVNGLVPYGQPQPQHFGAKGDGTTDDTAAIQAWVNYITQNSLKGYAPAGTYKLTATIATGKNFGWSIEGAGWQTTIFRMATDNTVIIDLGVNAGPALHSWSIANLQLDYANAQPSTNTGALCLRYSAMPYQFALRSVRFNKGYYGIACATTIGGIPWGYSYDDLYFASGLTGGAIDMTNVTSAGPNQRWGRIVAESVNMTAPVFRQIKGYNSSIEIIEIFNGGSAQWIDFQSGSQWNIGAIKQEIGAFSGTVSFTGPALIYAPSCSLNIGQIFIGGTTFTVNTTNSMYLVSGSVTSLVIDFINIGLSVAPTNFYLFGTNGGRTSLGRYLAANANVVPFTNIGSGTNANYLTYEWDNAPRLSDDIGNVTTYTWTSGGPNRIVAQTALTAPCSVEIMPDTNSLFNGRTVEVLSRGAVNGTNTITVKAGGVTLATLSANNTKVVLVWRRNAVAASGWLVTYQGAA